MTGFAWLPNETLNPWLFLGLGSLSALLISIAKAGFGSGIGLLAVPIMVYACGDDAPLAAGVMLPLLIACDWVSLMSWWRKWDLRQVALLLPGALLGIVAGGLLLWGMTALPGGRAATGAALKLAIGLISLGFVGLQILRFIRKSAAYRPDFWHGLGFGAAAGVTSTLAHGAGPVATMFLLPQRMPKGGFVATTVLFFWIVNQLKLVPYVALRLVGHGSLGASAVLLPTVVAGTFLGVFLHRRVGDRSFSGTVHVLLALAGAHMTQEAVRQLWF